MSVDAPKHEARGARPPAARLLVEIPWRQGGLIASCVLAGAAATLLLTAPRPSPRAAGAHAPRPPITPVGDAVHLHLDVDPVFELAFTPAKPASGATPAANAVLRLDDDRAFDALVAALETTPPAAGPATMVAAGEAFAAAGPGWRGPIAGLVLGLLLAAWRELRGGRMRTAREAQWALGVPVLGALPTLSPKALAASIGRAPRVADGAAAGA